MIQIKRGYQAAWASEAGTLAEGQPGISIRVQEPTEKIVTGELRVGKLGGGGTFSDAIRLLPKYYSYDFSSSTESTDGFNVYLGNDAMQGDSHDKGFRFTGDSTSSTTTGSIYFPYRDTNDYIPGMASLTGAAWIVGRTAMWSLTVGCDFLPESISCYLGSSSYKWGAVYAQNGTIQTSDKKSKTNIKKVKEISSIESSPGITGPEFEGQEMDSYPTAGITINDLVDCLKRVDAVTFNYLDINDKPDEHSHAIQLGLIADDILEANSNVFKYIGTKETIKKPNPEKYHKNITEKENFGKWVDKEGNVINEYELPEEDYVIEDELGLQPLPVATMSLAINKHLLNEIDKLKEEISELKSKMNN